MVLLKKERIVEHSSRILGLVAELDNAAHAVSEVEMNRTLLLGMPSNHGMTVEAIMSLPHTFGEMVYKLIVRDPPLRVTKDASPLALVTSAEHQQNIRKFFF